MMHRVIEAVDHHTIEGVGPYDFASHDLMEELWSHISILESIEDIRDIIEELWWWSWND